MSEENLWEMPMRNLTSNSAKTRAIHYRQQTAELRGMAKNQTGEGLLRNLLDLATSYDSLADAGSTQ